MRRLLVAAIALLLAHSATQGADISVLVEGTPEQPAIIFIQGMLQANGYLNDTSEFTRNAWIAIDYQRQQRHETMGFLDSPGGAIGTAIWIGEKIREYGFKTAIADHVKCASACALIWMGGTERYLDAKARLGFHSARGSWNKSNPAYNEVNGLGNDMIIRYLQRLGVREAESARLISAPPNSMTWVNVDSLATYGIAASYLRSAPQIVWPIARKRQHLDPVMPMKGKV